MKPLVQVAFHVILVLILFSCTGTNSNESRSMDTEKEVTFSINDAEQVKEEIDEQLVKVISDFRFVVDDDRKL